MSGQVLSSMAESLDFGRFAADGGRRNGCSVAFGVLGAARYTSLHTPVPIGRFLSSSSTNITYSSDS